MKHIVFAFTLLLLSSAAISQKVNYSGDWKLNEDKSELGSKYSLAPASLSIKHTRKKLEMKVVHIWDGQTLESEQFYTLDGKECRNAGFGESTTLSSASFDRQSKAIKIVTAGSAEGMDYTFSQLISLKGAQLVVNARAETDLGELTETYLFDKQ